MNRDIARGRWQQLKGALSARWGAITGDHLRVLTGRHQQFAGRLQVAYAVTQEELGRQLDGVERRSRLLRPRSHI